MSEKPLHYWDHLRRDVARAIGWTEVDDMGFYGMRPQKKPRRARVPDYPFDWRATGRLIERFGISVYRPDEFCPDREFAWVAAWGGAHGWDDGSVCADEQEGAATPLEAVCRLILRLKDAGKLDNGGLKV